jgi:hypothetical protein
MSGPGFGLGNPDKVFDKTGNNASGHVLDTPTFYALSVVSMLAGFLPPAGVAFLTRGWDIEHTSLWWYIAALVGVIVCMTAAAAYAIRCQNWALSLIAYLGFVAAPFGVLFGPFVHATGAQYLVPGLIITGAIMTIACLIGLALPKDLYYSWFGGAILIALIAYLIGSVA